MEAGSMTRKMKNRKNKNRTISSWTARQSRKSGNVPKHEATDILSAFEMSINVINSWLDLVPDSEYNSLCWFRGANNHRHDLLPGAYRFSPEQYDEYGPLVCFVQEGPAYAAIGKLNDWSTYYLAQHHSIKTRLLDWTESFTTALFFALDSYARLAAMKRTVRQSGIKPCVWMLNPEMVNMASIGCSEIISPENNIGVDLWLPQAIRQAEHSTYLEQSPTASYVYDNDYPLAIYPRKDNKRLVAQQGAFTVHGRSRTPLNQYVLAKCAERRVQPQIAYILLSPKNTDKWLADLSLLGVRRQSLFPDIDNFVRYVRDTYEPIASSDDKVAAAKSGQSARKPKPLRAARN
jgi:hypothetical protein